MWTYWNVSLQPHRYSHYTSPTTTFPTTLSRPHRPPPLPASPRPYHYPYYYPTTTAIHCNLHMPTLSQSHPLTPAHTALSPPPQSPQPYPCRQYTSLPPPSSLAYPYPHYHSTAIFISLFLDLRSDIFRVVLHTF